MRPGLVDSHQIRQVFFLLTMVTKKASDVIIAILRVSNPGVLPAYNIRALFRLAGIFVSNLESFTLFH